MPSIVESAPNPPQLDSKSLALVETSKALRIQNVETAKAAGDLRKQIKSERSHIAEMWKPIKEYWKSRHTKACDGEKDMDAPFKAAEEAINRDLKAYVDADAERQRKEAAAKAEIAEAFGATEEETQAIATAAPVLPSIGVAPRKYWRYKVTDKMAFLKHLVGHPTEAYLATVDEDMMKALMSNRKPELDKKEFTIPGIEFYQDTGIATSR